MSFKFEDAINIVKMIPAAIVAVKALEDFINVSGAGKAKLNLVLDTLQDAYNLVSDSWPTVKPIFEKLISGLVTIANTFGVFKKGTATDGSTDTSS